MQNTEAPVVVIIGRSSTALWGVSGEERLRRLMARAGVDNERVFHVDADELPVLPEAGRVVLFRTDYAYEEPVVRSLLATNENALLLPTDGSHGPAAGSVSSELSAVAFAALRAGGTTPQSLAERAPCYTPTELAGEYNSQLRKKAEFYVLRVTPDTRSAVEKRMFAGSYKGVTDIVTLVLFPWPSRMLTKLAARLGLAPNHVTTMGLLCAIAAFLFLWRGQFGAGLVAGWGLMLLDTVDGKLARVTLTSSKFGDVYDHAIDLIHPPFWYWAFIHGLGPERYPWLRETMSVIVVCYVLQRLLEGNFITRFGIEMHVWRRFDSRFRTITARRDVNFALLTLFWAVGQAALGMLVVTAWIVLSLVVHVYQTLHATLVRRRVGELRSWLADSDDVVSPASSGKNTLLRH